MATSGLIAGYDPGGNDRHGVCCLTIQADTPTAIAFDTVHNANSAIDWLRNRGSLIAIGIDTLTMLSTGDSGWRPADRWLRERYPDVRNSVVNPNYLQGSMALSGLAVSHELRKIFTDIAVIETHPKVLYYELCGRRYNYSDDQQLMNHELGTRLSLTTNTQTDHEWDAAISAFAALQSLTKNWTRDLHALPVGNGETLVPIAGDTHFYWPT
jgi:hypothetical protein